MSASRTAQTQILSKEKQSMEQDVLQKVVKILTPYAKNEQALANVSEKTHLLDELQVNSARLVDIILAFEDEFGIEIADDDADGVETVGDAVRLITAKRT